MRSPAQFLDRNRSSGQVVRYALIGCAGAATNFVIYASLVHLGFHYVFASFLGWFLALIPSFLANRYLTFDSAGSFVGDFVKTVLVYLSQQVFMIAMLAVSVEVLGASEIVGYVVALPVAASVSFLGFKYYAMRGAA